MKRREISGSVVTITGGTGSFGSVMARHALASGAAQVRIFSRDEAKQDALRHELGESRVRFYIGDTRDEETVRRVVRGSDLVFHAAALKQVPSAEFFPLEAVKTNINGSANVLRAAVDFQVASVVCLSTDKAVYPINAMGMSKALMEKTAQAFAREYQDSETSISITRYGNVMYSRGSVIPLFIEQIKSGRELTITDPEMTRFLMSLSQSVELVEYAFSHAHTGDLFVRKAPAATIQDLALALIDLFGGDPAKLKVIGVRHGEKKYESLLGVEERGKSQDRGDYFRIPLDARDLNYSLYFEQGQQQSQELESYNSHNTHRLNVAEIKDLLMTLPEIQKQMV